MVGIVGTGLLYDPPLRCESVFCCHEVKRSGLGE